MRRIILVPVVLSVAAIAVVAATRAFVEEATPPQKPAMLSVPPEGVSTEGASPSVRFLAASGTPIAAGEETSETAVVSFPDGSSVSVIVGWIRPRPPPLHPLERLSDGYSKLVQLAHAGDGAAARTLHRELSKCQRAHIDERSLNSAIDRLRRQRSLQLGSNLHARSVGPGEDLEVIAESDLRGPYRYCEGITIEQRMEAAEWARRAAAAGDYLGLQDWARSLGNTEAALQAWQSAWDRGYMSALPPLARLYASGALSSTGHEPDHVRAYAYKYINFKLMEAKYGVEPMAGQINMLASVESSLNHTGSFLTPLQTQQAIKIAKHLLETNQYCCRGSW
ncbi:MAG: hypothetical protein HC872_03495 [Gammaproteobacteria bacterium]|nr:hypothetical protein [Gammaproteobacteria bacterium]